MARQGWVSLYDGKSLTGFKARHPEAANTWQSAAAVEVDPADAKKLVSTAGEGVLVNGPAGRTTDIRTVREFGDCEAHVEFVVSQGSNSGVYFKGEYEIQILDSFGKEKVTFGDCGGIYARWVNDQNVEGHAPRENASRPPGKWQEFDVVFRAPRFDVGGRKIENARFISVRHNGVLIHENVSLNGPTRGSLTGQERPTGPIMLQGDHGPVAFRNLRIKPSCPTGS
ncbi:MAG: DUF1080 domain-containing protein [Planctomycetes bacterium]|nr:DUF1080 domain-containing protein [Planctomycetota bacterium]